MKKHLYPLAIALLMVFTVSCDLLTGGKDDEDGGDGPSNVHLTVETIGVSEVSGNSAVMYFTSRGAHYNDKGVYYSTRSGDDEFSAWDHDDDIYRNLMSQWGSNQFRTKMRDLEPSTTYYARPFVMGGNGNVFFGDEVSFTTSTQTPFISDITIDEQSGNYVLVSFALEGEGDVKSFGICCVESEKKRLPVIGDKKGEGYFEHDDLDEDVWSHPVAAMVSGLKEHTEYLLRAYFITENDSAVYSDKIETFYTHDSTPGQETPEFAYLANITALDTWASIQHGAYGEYYGPLGIREHGICYSSSVQNPTIDDSKEAYSYDYYNSEVGTILEDLSPSTTYYVRIYARTNNGDVYYSDAEQFTTLAPATEINIPDPNFKALLLREYDADGDGIFTTLDAAQVTMLGAGGNNIVSMVGLEHFVNLTELYCHGNEIAILDLSKNTKLKKLGCYSNNITELDLRNNPLLETVDCDNNELISLKLSGCTKLTRLDCYNNKLRALDVSSNVSLRVLSCYNNYIESLDVRKMTSLKSLDCHNNKLASLQLGTHPDMEDISASSNELKTIDLSGCKVIVGLTCGNNELTSLDLSACPQMNWLDCQSNEISTLNLGNNKGFASISCEDNKLKGLNVSDFILLTDLSCNNNELTSLNISGCSALKRLYAGYNNLTSLSVLNLRALNYLDCKFNSLTTLTLTGAIALEMLNCNYNNLSELNVSTNTFLSWIDIGRNNITYLNLSNNPEVVWCNRDSYVTIEGWDK